jgi:hypothetical protein
MAITPSSPIPRTPVARWEIDGFGIRINAHTVVLVYFGYDANNIKIAEKRFDLSDTSSPTFAAFIAACPAGPTLRRQIEQFGASLDSELSGSVD